MADTIILDYVLQDVSDIYISMDLLSIDGWYYNS
jgi:hypothetical protein